jgi:hypothetical protein
MYKNKLRANLFIEVEAVKKAYPQFSYTGKAGHFILNGTLHPSNTSPDYKVQITLLQDKNPKVIVIDPPLIKIPKHVYRNNNDALCLYYPGVVDWKALFFLRDKLVPWISLWLLYYEQWLETGIWYGDEYEHAGGKKSD